MPIQNPKETLERVRTLAERSGAAEVETYFEFITFAEARVREREVELVQQSAITGFGLRVLRDRKMGFLYTTDLRRKILDEMVVRTIALAAQASPRDENRLPDQTFIPAGNLEIEDASILRMRPEDLIPLARSIEDNALAHDKRVQTTRSTRAGYVVGEVHFSNTFIPYQMFRSTEAYYSCTAVAVDGDKKREGSYFDRKRIFQDLTTPERLGRKASERAVAKLGAKAVPSTKAPVIFEADAAGAFLGGLVGAFNALNVLEQRTFLANRKGQQIASPLVTIVDDGIMRRGLGTRPFDGEGSQTRKTVVVDRGVMTRFLHTAATARRSNVTPTGNATRGYDSLPVVGPTNFYIDRGSAKPDQMIQQVPKGLYVTGSAGFGFDLTAGEYSQQVEGFWIEGGKIVHPVEGVTVAGKLDEMLLGIDAVGRDLDFRSHIASPTIRFKELTIGGV
ncbi:MAG TPA: TldD/PmbA family protein [Candidatus Eisenbacteria bacterium]|nr:TldD/PmbA family protein [Candidatus Eisenbacteria bacterium]